MELNDAINHLKESLADPTHKWGCEECKQEHEQLLVWLEDYKQLKADYIELDNRLRTANTEIDRLQSVSSWIPCSERKPDDDSYNWSVGITSSGRCIAFQEHNAYENDTGGISVPTYLAHGSEITHWMPLPQTPEVINNVD